MPDSIKQGWGDKLYNWYTKDVKTAGLTILTLVIFWQQNKINDLNQDIRDISDKMFERVIVEVEKRQDPRLKNMEDKIDTIKSVSDSSRNDIRSTTKQIRAVAGKIEKSFNSK
jgi:hypothetical protein